MDGKIHAGDSHGKFIDIRDAVKIRILDNKKKRCYVPNDHNKNEEEHKVICKII